MLVHIVCWRYKAEIGEAAKEEHRNKLRALTGTIDSLRSLVIGSDILHLERSFDTGLVATFDDEAGLKEYTVHPEHQKVAAIGREISQQVVSVDFISDSGGEKANDFG